MLGFDKDDLWDSTAIISMLGSLVSGIFANFDSIIHSLTIFGAFILVYYRIYIYHKRHSKK